jgi:hypothetical protein
MEQLKNEIINLTRPYLPKQEGKVFFKAFAAINESDSGIYAKTLHGDHSGRNLVMSRGIVIDTEHGHHQVLYEHNHKMENGHLYKTILGRAFDDLSVEELKNIRDAVADNIKKEKVFPALITEGYDEDLGDEEHNFFSVKFNKPLDEEQVSTADAHECETINNEKGEFVFMDYDDAIGFAYDNTINFETRNNVRRIVVDNNNVYFNVTFESDDKRLEDLAEQHHGGVDFTSDGTPLAIAGFTNLNDARAYIAAVRNILTAENTVKMRTDISGADILKAERAAKDAIRERIVSPDIKTFSDKHREILSHYISMFSKDSSTEELLRRVFDSVVNDGEVIVKPEKWKTDTWRELFDFANGREREAGHGLRI